MAAIHGVSQKSSVKAIVDTRPKFLYVNDHTNLFFLLCLSFPAFRGKVLRSFRADQYLRARCREELNIRDRRRAELPPGIPDYILETLSSSQDNESHFDVQEEDDDIPQLPCPLTPEAISDYHRLWQAWSRRLHWNLDVEMSGDGRLPEKVSEIVYVPGPAVITTVYLVTVIKVFKGEQYVAEQDIAQVFSWGLNLHSDFIYILSGKSITHNNILNCSANVSEQ